MCLIGKPLTGLINLALLSVYSMAPSAAAQEAPIEWDTIYTHDGMYTGNPPGVKCVGLVVSNHGEMGHVGLGRVNMDYVESGLECGTRPEDAVYLYSSSPFVILADDASGTNASLTCSYGDVDGTSPCAWVPDGEPGSGGGLAICTPVWPSDAQYSAKMISRDGFIALERFLYPGPDEIWYHDFVVVVSKVYSNDGRAHNHVTVGSVTDWNVPSDSANVNKSATTWDMMYVQGTDTSLSQACQPHSHRYASEAFEAGLRALNSFKITVPTSKAIGVVWPPTSVCLGTPTSRVTAPQ
jgi:hypothetical protein